MNFDSIDYVINGHEYEFKCKNAGEFFPPDYKVDKIRLKCDGTKQHYIDQKSKEIVYKMARKCGVDKPKAG